MRINKKKKARTACQRLLFLLPSLAGVTVFVFLPFLDVIRRSFTSAVTGEFRGLENFRNVFANQAFQLAVRNTCKFVLVCLPLLLLLGLLAAVALSRARYRQTIKALYLFPMAMPAATVVLIWKMLFHRQGFLNLAFTKIGEIFGFGPVLKDYMGTSAAFWILVVSYLWKNLGYTLVLWLAGILAIPSDIIQAARVDGATYGQCFRRIILPNLKGCFYTITVISFLNSFKVFREAYLVAGSYPHDSIYLLQHLFNNWFVSLDLDKMAAAAVCVGAVLFVFILLLQRLWDREE